MLAGRLQLICSIVLHIIHIYLVLIKIIQTEMYNYGQEGNN